MQDADAVTSGQDASPRFVLSCNRDTQPVTSCSYDAGMSDHTYCTTHLRVEEVGFDLCPQPILPTSCTVCSEPVHAVVTDCTTCHGRGHIMGGDEYHACPGCRITAAYRIHLTNKADGVRTILREVV